MAEEKFSPKKGGKRAGGRPISEGWSLYDFEKVDGDKGKCLAKCSRCHSVLKNTSISRMRNHRKKCGSVTGSSPSKDIQKLIQSKIELDESDREEVIEHTVEHNTVLWTESDQIETYVDESVPIEKVNQTALEIINGDIQRHVQQRKSTSSKKRRRSSIDSSSIDVSLSSFLIGCSINFEAIDSPYFKKFMEKVNPNYTVPSSNQLKSSVLLQLETSHKSSKKRKGGNLSYSGSDSE